MVHKDINRKADSDVNTPSEEFTAFHYSETGREARDVNAAVEIPVTIILNNEELVTLLASPDYLDLLAAGYLFSEALLKSKDDIEKIAVDKAHGVVRVDTREVSGLDTGKIYKRIITSGCGRGTSFYSSADVTSKKVLSSTTISPGKVFEMARHFQQLSKLYVDTHGVHSAAIYDNGNLLVFHEDIGRHSALDKVFGHCLIDGIDTGGKVVITTGRVTSEIMYKISKRDIPILISISAPTNMGVKIADSLNITLIARVRGKKMDVFTHGWRIS